MTKPTLPESCRRASLDAQHRAACDRLSKAAQDVANAELAITLFNHRARQERASVRKNGYKWVARSVYLAIFLPLVAFLVWAVARVHGGAP